MAFVTAKAGGRFEIRETRRTPHGPRATTLATFRVLDSAVLERARSRARRPFDDHHVRAGARRLGAPEEAEGAEEAEEAEEAEDAAGPDGLTQRLLGDMAQGRLPAPGLRRVLADALAQTALPAGDGLGDLALWIGVPDVVRARALEDLLGLADAIPTRPRAGGLSFPRLSSTGGGGGGGGGGPGGARAGARA
jgi:hypothetical protein